MPHGNERSLEEEREGAAPVLSLASFAEMRRVTGMWFAGDPWSNEGQLRPPLRRIIRCALYFGRRPPLLQPCRRRSERTATVAVSQNVPI